MRQPKKFQPLPEWHSYRVRLGRQGRLVIPAELRRQLKAREGEDLIAYVKDGSLCVESLRTAEERMHARWQKAYPDRSPVDELIAERRLEAKRER